MANRSRYLVYFSLSMLILTSAPRAKAFGVTDTLETAFAATLAHSFYTYYYAIPTEGNDDYTLQEIAQGIRNGDENMMDLLKCAYEQKLIGHPSAIGEATRNEDGVVEVPFIKPRGLYGKIGSHVDSVEKAITLFAALDTFARREDSFLVRLIRSAQDATPKSWLERVWTGLKTLLPEAPAPVAPAAPAAPATDAKA